MMYMYIEAMYIIRMDEAANELDVPITGLVWRLSMRWRSAIDRAITPLGLTNAQYALLAPLLSLERAGQRPSQRQLADVTGLESLYVSKLARSLERAGLITRTGHPQDSRAVQLTLTDAGRDVVTQAITRVVALQDELLAPLGGPHSSEAQTFVRSVKTLLAPIDPAEPTGEQQ
jgi:DNA-binding MarR family transcriptional regulator